MIDLMRNWIDTWMVSGRLARSRKSGLVGPEVGNVIFDKELKEKISLLRKESLNLRFQKSSGQLEKTARIREVKKQIARLKTAENMKGRKDAKKSS